MTRRPRLAAALLGAALAMPLLSACGDEPGAIGPRVQDSPAMGADRFADVFEDGATPLVRTDFSDDAAWARIVTELTKETSFDDSGEDGYAAHLDPIDDPAFEGVSAAALAAQWDRAREVSGYVLLADAESMRQHASGEAVTVEYMDLTPTPEVTDEFGWVYGRAFRCVLDEVASIEANLSIANMDFEEFADEADENGGVFTGFPE